MNRHIRETLTSHLAASTVVVPVSFFGRTRIVRQEIGYDAAVKLVAIISDALTVDYTGAREARIAEFCHETAVAAPTAARIEADGVPACAGFCEGIPCNGVKCPDDAQPAATSAVRIEVERQSQLIEAIVKIAVATGIKPEAIGDLTGPLALDLAEQVADHVQGLRRKRLPGFFYPGDLKRGRQ